VSLFLVALFLLTPDATAAEAGTVEGQVVHASDGQPIRKAIVTLRSALGMRSYEMFTGADGRFTFTGVEPGRYSVTVLRDGFMGSVYIASSEGAVAIHMTGGREIAVSPDQRITGLLFRLKPFGVVSGKISNEDADPLPNASVQVLRQVYRNGKRELQPAGATSTNDLGEYRVYSLLPGRYYMFALPGRTGLSKLESNYAPRYYPNALEPSGAAQIDLTAGGEARGIDVTFTPTPTVSVRGRIEYPAEFKHASTITLQPRSVAVFAPTNLGRAIPAQDGSFEIRNVHPGSYTLSATDNTTGQFRIAFTNIEVGTGDVEGVALAFVPNLELTGHLHIDSEAVRPAHITLQRRERMQFYSNAVATVKEDGSFLFQAVLPGEYDLDVALPPRGYLKSARLDDEDVLGKAIHLGAAPSALEVTISTQGATIDGTVEDDGRPIAGATVVLVPDAARRNASLYYRRARTDLAGKFTLLGIAPGAYKVFAWEEIEDGAWQDPDFLGSYEARGESVRLEQQGHESVALRLLR
jgi:Carboxypeptidase regulatory-like domain